MIIPKEGMFLKVKDENGQDIKFVVGAESDKGFVVILTDISPEGFPLSLKTERKYCKFTINGV